MSASKLTEAQRLALELSARPIGHYVYAGARRTIASLVRRGYVELRLREGVQSQPHAYATEAGRVALRGGL